MKLSKSIQQFGELNKVKNRMDNIFMNSENSKTLEPHRIFLTFRMK